MIHAIESPNHSSIKLVLLTQLRRLVFKMPTDRNNQNETISVLIFQNKIIPLFAIFKSNSDLEKEYIKNDINCMLIHLLFYINLYFRNLLEFTLMYFISLVKGKCRINQVSFYFLLYLR